MRTVEIKISPDGSQVTSDAQGFVGGECHKQLDPILKALGTVAENKAKTELHQTVGSHTQLSN